MESFSFGLNVSPNSFSRMMSLAFTELSPEKCFLYIDDIIVTGCSEKSHKFFKSEVVYFGHHVLRNKGIYPDDSELQVVKNYPIPNDKDSARRFIAFMNYYRKFIQTL